MTLTTALVDIPSESRHEAAIADAVEAALRTLGHLSVERDGNTVVARTTLGRAERVVLGGHLDTVPAADNLPARLEGDRLSRARVLRHEGRSRGRACGSRRQ